MEKSKITVREDEQTIEDFSQNCEKEGTNMSAEIRKFIRRYNRRVVNSRVKMKKVN
jgi:hypothetical protein